jgi:hypothetical protein
VSRRRLPTAVVAPDLSLPGRLIANPAPSIIFSARVVPLERVSETID